MRFLILPTVPRTPRASRSIPIVITISCLLGATTSILLLPPPSGKVSSGSQSRSITLANPHVLAAETATPPDLSRTAPATPAPTPPPNQDPNYSLAGVGFAAGSNLAELSAAEQSSELAGMKALGVSWVRYDFQWNVIQASGPGSYNWAPYDQLATTAAAYKLKTIGIIDYTPTWAAVSGCSSFACAPANPQAYGTFAAAVAAHYASYGITTWEIWNEPNNVEFFQPQANPATYTAMLKAAYLAIKQDEPGATVLTGGLAPATTDGSSYSPPDFLSDMYANGAHGYFDAVGDHPYTFPVTATFPNAYNAWGQMIQMHNIMAVNGDGNKSIWITEYGAPTNGPGPTATGDSYVVSASHVTEALQAQMVTDFFEAARSLPWLGPVMWYTYQDSGTDTSTNENFFGLVRADGSSKPAYQAFQQALQ